MIHATRGRPAIGLAVGGRLTPGNRAAASSWLVLGALLALSGCREGVSAQAVASSPAGSVALAERTRAEEPVIRVRGLTGERVSVTESGRYEVSIEGLPAGAGPVLWGAADPTSVEFDECPAVSEETHVSCAFRTRTVGEGEQVVTRLFARLGDGRELAAEIEIVPLSVGVRRPGQSGLESSLELRPGEELELVVEGAGLDRLQLGWISSNHALIGTENCYGTGTGLRLAHDGASAACRLRVAEIETSLPVQLGVKWMTGDRELQLQRMLQVVVRDPGAPLVE
jgi:hypothetical protein